MSNEQRATSNEQSLYQNLSAYSGYFKDNNKLLASASGGAATAISEGFIKNFNGLVIGATYSSDCRNVEFACISTIEDLHKLKGSKYAASDKKIFDDENKIYQPVFKYVGDKLSSGQKILFFGLGCDIKALYSYLEHNQINTQNLFTSDLICYGATLKKVHTDYINSLEQKFNSQVKYFTVRYKKVGWTPFYIRAEFDNGKIFEKNFYESDYGYAFANFANQPCFHCNARGLNHIADVTVADFWGLTEKMQGFNKNGVSIILARSQKGQQLVNLIDTNNFELSEANPEFIITHNGAYFTTRVKPKNYERFLANLNALGLHKAVSHEKFFTLPKRTALFILRLPKRIIRKSLKILGLWDFVQRFKKS